MVWHQYVWEATTGNEADVSDDDYESHVHDPIHIDDWIDFNSGELNYLWAIIQEYGYDANSTLLRNMTCEDLARFFYDPPLFHERTFDLEYWVDKYSEELEYTWKLLRNTRSRLVHKTTYEDFTFFCYTSR